MIPGKPLTWSRTGHGQHGPRFTPADRRAQMGDIRNAWIDLEVPRFEKGTYLALTALFYFDRPSSHFGTGRNAGVMKPWAEHARPGLGTNGGDLDNLVKLVTDALNSVAYADDGQIAEFTYCAKLYCEPGTTPRTEVVLRDLDTSAESEDERAQMALA